MSSVTANSIKFLQRCGWVTECNSALRDSGSLIQSLRNLETLTRLLEAEFSLKLPRVPLLELKDVKRFCEGILDHRTTHAWRSSLRDNHIPLRERSSVCASLFMFRKSLPQEKLSKRAASRQVLDYIDKMTTAQEPPPSDLLLFARDLVNSEFGRGWDRSWWSEVESFTLPVTSCLENRAGAGGVRALHCGERQPFYFEDGYLDSEMGHMRRRMFFVDEERRPEKWASRGTKPMIIWTGGKNRLVTCFSAWRTFLSPLHKTIYNHLSTKEWLLRGDASEERFFGFSKNEGEVFVSGDYESATDNLNIHLTELLLDTMAQTSTRIPAAMWDHARLALRSEFEGGRLQQRGQLMGSLLSFPLLCLSNYVAFRYYVRRPVPVKINGDDIVFRSTYGEYLSWRDGVQDFGLTLSVGKTLVSKTLFSLNSTFFLGRATVSAVPLLRSSCIFVKAEDASSLAGRSGAACRGFSKQTKEKVDAIILRLNAAHVWSSQRSIIRGLGCPVSFRTVRSSGFSKREACYSSLPTERPMPAPYKRWAHWPTPKGWRCVRVDDPNAVDDFGFKNAVISSCWDPSFNHEDISRKAYLAAVQEGTLHYVPFPSRRHFKMLGKCAEDYDELARRITVHNNRRQMKVWRKDVGTGCAVRFRSVGAVSC